MSLAYDTDLNLGQAIFGHGNSRDANRRNRALVDTFNLMQRHPGGTLPDKFVHSGRSCAFYRRCRRR